MRRGYARRGTEPTARDPESAGTDGSPTCYTDMMRWRRPGRRTWWALTGLLAAVIAIAVVLVTGGDERPAPVENQRFESAAPAQPPSGESPPAKLDETPPPEATDEDPLAEPPPLDERSLTPSQRWAARAVRAYVEGLDARDGGAVCHLLFPGVIDGVDLPRRRGSCADSLRASIGYRDPRGLPVWDSARVRGLLTVAVDGDRASVTVTTVTRFADRDQPSIEDDVVHLRREAGRWLIAKPSSTLHRAVGIADVPPRVLAPPD
jgi:hypothetical protein